MNACFIDFDSTLITKESLDEVIAYVTNVSADVAAINAKVEELTNLGMAGQLDFKSSVLQRLALAPLSLADFVTIGEKLTAHITAGFTEFIAWLQQEKWQIFVVSGGFLPAIYPTTNLLNIPQNNVFANNLLESKSGKQLLVDESQLLWSNEGKTPVIRHLCQQNSWQKTVLIGDGANDLQAYQAGVVDTFIGFGGNATRAIVKQQAPHFITDITESYSYFS